MEGDPAYEQPAGEGKEPELVLIHRNRVKVALQAGYTRPEKFAKYVRLFSLINID